MATSYTHNSWGHAVGYWWFEVSETDVNIANNTSKVTVKLYVKAAHNNQRSDTYNNYPAGYGSSTPWAKIWIDGTQVVNQVPACFDIRYNSSKKIANGTTYLLATGSKVVTHGSDGAKNVSIKCQHYTSVSPNNVTLENTAHTLTTIKRASSWSFSDGTFNIGSTYNYSIYPYSGNFEHRVYVSKDNSNWTQVASGVYGTANQWNSKSFTIPNIFGIGNQQTCTMYIKAQTYSGSTCIGTATKQVTVKNNNYELKINEMYITNNTYIENGKYTAGKTRMYVYYNASSTFNIKRVDFKMTGSNSNSGGWDNPGKSNTWDSGIVNGVGNVTITMTLTDTAGHQTSRSISATVYAEEHQLSITGLKCLNSALYVKNNDVNSSETQIKTQATWSNTHAISKIEFKLTGANSQSWYLNNPTGNSYTWTSNHIYNAGTNTVTFVIHDSKGSSQSSSININSSVEPWSISCGDSYIDSKLCVNLINGEFYKDYTRVGVRIKVNHTHDLKYINVVINNKSYELSNIDPAANEFTFVCNDYLTYTGNTTVTINVGDVNGRSATKSETIYVKPLIVDAPPVPKIEFEDSVSLMLSEGEKVVFTGTSTDIKDYQIIYGLAPCDVIKATSMCNSNNNSYYGVDAYTLNQALKSNETNSIERYSILKDFDEDNSCVTRDTSNTKKFHLHPLQPNHDDRYYALQWLKDAKPGDAIYIYVIERAQGTFDMLYSDNTAYNKVPKSNMFNMCVIPLAPCPISIYMKEQTEDKLIIEYANPIYNVNSGAKNPVHLIDVCLIARDSHGDILNKNENKKRDGLNGKTWLYYSQRYWHNIYTSADGNANGYYTANRYTMEFDISGYPSATNLAVVAFYYTDYYNHPSIYSESNIILSGKQNIDISLSFVEPLNNSSSTTANPKVVARVHNEGSIGDNGYNIYEQNYNLATSWKTSSWNTNPVWIRVPVSQDSQVPNFRTNATGEYYFKAKGLKPSDISKADYNFEFYNLHQNVYKNNDLYKISGLNIESSGVYVENCLFLKLNDNIVSLGDIYTDKLLESSYIDYDWQQETGRFLSMGKNKLELYTCPYKYGQKFIQYNELDGSWLSEGMFVSNPIMPYNPFNDSIVRPSSESDWSKVEGDVLEIEIPYKLLKPNFSYNLKYSILVDKGFAYSGQYAVSSEQEQNDLICNTYVFSKVIEHKEINVSGDNDIYTDLIYRPSYTVTDKGYSVSTVNNYDKWINKTITFTTPSQAVLESLQNENMVVRLTVRGVYKLKVSNISLISIDGNHIIDSGRTEIDSSVQENYTSIIVNYSVTNFDFGYIDPLSYYDMLQLRDYLLYLADIYEVTDIKPAWRTLIKDHSYLMARDFNDVKNYCIDLFTEIGKKHPDIFNGNISLFTSIPTIQSNEKRGRNTYSSRGKHYFPEWDDLVDAIKNQSK